MYQIPKERFEFKINKEKLTDRRKLLIQLLKISKRIVEKKGLDHLETKFLINQKNNDFTNDNATAIIEFHTTLFNLNK